MGIFKRFFKKKEPLKDITLGERDEKGFCDVYADGEKTNVRMLVFTPEQAKHLQEVSEQAYKNL